MKKAIFYVMTFAVMLFASCNNETNLPEGGDDDQGEVTYMELRLSMPKSYSTRSEQAGTEEESVITSIDVFIYRPNGFLQTHVRTTATQDGGQWKTSAIETTTGPKYMFVVANLSQEISALLTSEHTTMGALKSVAFGTDGISANGNFTMSSDLISATLDIWDGVGGAPAGNTINASVRRIAAKFTVEKTAETITAMGYGNISNLEFGVGQTNTEMFLMQNEVEGNVVDPNYADVILDGALTEHPVVYNEVMDHKGSVGSEINTLPGLYAAENTSLNPIAKNLTYVAVKALFTPLSMMVKSEETWSEVPFSGTTFYCIRVEGSAPLFFNSEVNAELYADDYSIDTDSILTYDGGYCYYTIFVNKDKKYNVYRNDFYRVSIKKIYGLGDTKPGPIDSEEPVSVKTYIEFNVTVLPWTLVEEETNLSPQ